MIQSVPQQRVENAFFSPQKKGAAGCPCLGHSSAFWESSGCTGFERPLMEGVKVLPEAIYLWHFPIDVHLTVHLKHAPHWVFLHTSIIVCDLMEGCLIPAAGGCMPHGLHLGIPQAPRPHATWASPTAWLLPHGLLYYVGSPNPGRHRLCCPTPQRLG